MKKRLALLHVKFHRSCECKIWAFALIHYVSMILFSRGIDQPYHHPGDKYKCAILNEDKEMELVDCLDESMSICKRPVEISIVPPNTYGCQHGQFEYQGSCYEIMHDYKTFSNAESSCKSNGGDLISINDG